LKKLLLFGAGKIGRSFIGQLFSRGGYEIVFVDISREIIDQLNLRKSYQVIIKSDSGDEILEVDHVGGLHFDQTEKIITLIAATDLIATAVGPVNLPAVIRILGIGLKKRFSERDALPVDIILAENLRNAADYFRDQLRNHLSEQIIREQVGLVETSIGKMVPIMTREEIQQDILQIYAEPYNTLILDKMGFKNPLPDVNGLAPKENMKAWVDRKSFIHNLGHASAAYFGFLKHPDYPYLYQILEDPAVYNFARSAMMESAAILTSLYPSEFTLNQLENHIDDLLSRFRNKSLRDTVHRVGRDLYRKLGPEDRLVGAIRLGQKTGKSFDQIINSLVCGFYFRSPDEDGRLYLPDQRFANFFEHEDIPTTLEKVCNFNRSEDEAIFRKVLKANRQIVSKFSGQNKKP
jgi:mannitol-1-phosphate 5-dehydrogenase